jgi:branched-chain amino acid transport system substrate-binding protein
MKKIAIIILILFISACAQQQEEVRIGAVLHLSANDYVNVGEAMREGIELAVAEKNAEGGIDGKKVVVIYEDSQYSIPKAVNAANKLIDVDHVSGTLISTYTEVMGAGPTFEQKKTPVIVLWDSSKEIDDLGEHVFAVGAWTESAGSKAADYAYHELGLRKVSIIHNNAEWSNAIAGYFAQRFTSLGGTILSTESLPEGDTDFRTLITKSKDKHPDGYFIPLSTGLDLFFKQARQAGITEPLLSADAMTQQTIDAAAGAAEGVYHTTLVLPETAKANAFRQKYVDFYHKEPDLLLYNGLGYDGAKALMRAIELKGTTPEAVKEGLYSIHDLEGSFGILNFSSAGSSPRYESVVQVRNGKEVVVMP